MRFARDDNLLFCSAELDDYLKVHLQETVLGKIHSADEGYLLNVDAGSWAEALAEDARVTPVTVLREKMYLDDRGEAQVDVSHEHFQRAIRDPSQPFFVPGRRVEIRVPFAGNPDFLFLTSSRRSLNPPRGEVRGAELVFDFTYPADGRPDIKTLVEQELGKIESLLGYTEGTIDTWNANLEREAKQTIERRRERVLNDLEHLNDLGIPVRRRDDAPQTFAAPAVSVRTQPTTRGSPRTEPSVPDPTLVGELYEHALDVTRQMGHAMERAPDDYAHKNEESLRDQLLVMLNSHFEGSGQAEAFNKAGKTDILIRFADRNIFIAECKWWSGMKGLHSALGQLFSYATWRDTKLALIMFVREKKLSAIIDKAKSALAEHTEFVAFDERGEETELRCTMRWPGDPDRHATLHVSFFHLPRVDLAGGR